MIFNFYLDIVGRIILSQCDKYLLPALFGNENRGQCRNATACLPQNCFPMKKHKTTQNIFIFAVKLIKGLVVTSCQSVDPLRTRYCYDVYTLGKHYWNPYLSIDRPKKEEKRDE